MERSRFSLLILLLVWVSLAGCSLQREDVGPYQKAQQTYNLTGFDRLDMGSAFAITVQQGTTSTIQVEGDHRNLDDLEVFVRNGTFNARYRTNRRREHPTTFTITMPILRGIDFSGASQSTITGFTNVSDLAIKLSGASKSQFTGQVARTTIDLSGASHLSLNGNGATLLADLSGASGLDGFAYSVAEGTIRASGASHASVSVASALSVEASGASSVRYRGNPTLRQRTSGASTVQPD